MAKQSTPATAVINAPVLIGNRAIAATAQIVAASRLNNEAD